MPGSPRVDNARKAFYVLRVNLSYRSLGITFAGLIVACDSSGAPVGDGPTEESDPPIDAPPIDLPPNDSVPLEEFRCTPIPEIGMLFAERAEWRNADESARLLLTRSADFAAGRITIDYMLRDASVSHPLTGTVCVTDAADLSYTVAHHNWGDTADIRAHGIQYDFEQGFASDTGYFRFSLSARREENDAPVWGPIVLLGETCEAVGPFPDLACAWDR